MSSTTTQSTPQTVTLPRSLQAAAIGGGIAALVNLVLFLVGNALNGSPMQVTMGPPPAEMSDLTFVAVIIMSVIPAFLAGGLYYLLTRFVAAPWGQRVFLGLSTGVLLLSFAPFTQGGFTLVSIGILATMHIVAAVTIVGTLLRFSRQ